MFGPLTAFTGTPIVVSSQIPALDFNVDGSIDDFDTLGVADAVDLQLPEGDFNNDGGVNFFDVVSYIRARETAGL